MARSDSNHIDPADLSDLLAGRVGEAREREFRQHLQVCGVCQAELALAESFHQQATDTPLAPEMTARLEAGFAASRPRTLDWRIISGRRPWVRAALLAASLACVWLGINALNTPSLRQGPSGDMRAARPAAAWDLQLSEPESGRIEVEWPTVDGAREYEIRLQSTSGETLWSRRVVAAPYEITFATLPAAVRSERFLFVTVVALMTDGTHQATQPQPLPVRP